MLTQYLPEPQNQDRLMSLKLQPLMMKTVVETMETMMETEMETEMEMEMKRIQVKEDFQAGQLL